MTTNNPVTNVGPPAGEPGDGLGARESAIRVNLLAALGRPRGLYRVNILPLWGDHFRVNVVTGVDPTEIRIPHSYFLAADIRGNIIEATPPITRLY
ncbi:MAG TPA: hypothetical protein VH092_35620 [Urbifossiella sp.]|jgi:hypothetical protein|nr:hypothetical protein [Urbifossiella sp.]